MKKKKKQKKQQEKSWKKQTNLKRKKNIRELIIDTIEDDYDKLIKDLKIEKGFKIERIKK